MNETIRLKITFNFNYIETIDNFLINYNIIHKSFNSDVSYVLEVADIDVDKIIYYLLLLTSKQIKIENISSIKQNHDELEVGTDKPIGSKDAIDEN
ncbi:MAG: hypothetical protein IJB21_06585 [Bacilli bacterium]|nr:hypothetical protein [Bacilli bacterium]